MDENFQENVDLDEGEENLMDIEKIKNEISPEEEHQSNKPLKEQNIKEKKEDNS